MAFALLYVFHRDTIYGWHWQGGLERSLNVSTFTSERSSLVSKLILSKCVNHRNHGSGLIYAENCSQVTYTCSRSTR
jgi:hypothetical protein